MRPHRTIVLSLVFSLFSGQIIASSSSKKLIEYGWDVPSTRFVRENIRQMERIPFDGVVIKILPKPDSSENAQSLGWRVFNKTPIEPAEIEHAVADLKATTFKRFSDNFIQMIVDNPEGGWWGPSWKTVCANAALLARVARQGGCKGLMFDPEDYGGNLWSYANLVKKDPEKRTWEQYVEQVKRRGREFITAINAEYPDLTMLCLVGPAISSGHLDITQDRYGLLFAFFDGMAEAATPKTVLVDGFEQSYPFLTREQFQAGRRHILGLSREITTNKDAFDKHIRAGFALWADFAIGWNCCDFQKNWFTPAGFRASLAYALEASDRYVWVYSERLRWWDFNTPDPYVQALALAKKGPGSGDPNPPQLIELPRDGWLFQTDEKLQGENQKWQQPDYDDSAWQKIRVDSAWDHQIDRQYSGAAWYRLSFKAPTVKESQKVYLILGAADEVGWAWLNGRYLRGHFFDEGGANQPWSVDVTDWLKPGQTNVLAVRVFNPGGAGGIWQAARLMLR
ncbi:MAG: beta galactosidase jelly roll domain-containing protein [Armatimonadetes bacterium]|nr:beta galactosidase jelly roll domain-containing protein [Armatimonadota bacterium]